jgi:hypothetical protein
MAEAVQRRLDENPEKMRQRRETVEHPFGTQGLDGRGTLSAEDAAVGRLGMALRISLQSTRVTKVVGIGPLIKAFRA